MCLMMSFKGNAHFPKSLMSSFCSLKQQVSKPGYVCWNCKSLIIPECWFIYKYFLCMQLWAPHLIKILQIHLMDFFYLAENLWKFFEESVTMDLYFSHFSVLLRTTLNYFTTKIIFCRLPKGFLPQKTLEQGDLSLLKFSPEETFVQKRPLGQEQFCPRKCLTLLGKSTCGLAEYWHTRIQLLGKSV